MQRAPQKLLLAPLLLAAAAAAVVVWRRPVASGRRLLRLRLRLAGLRRRRLELPRQRLVYFAGGPRRGGGEGARGTLLCLHGLGDQAGTWARVAPRLLAGYRLLVPDLPGHGATGLPRQGDLSLSDGLAAVEALVEREAPEGPLVLLGNSLGGWLALLYALEHPRRIDRLVLLASAGLAHEFEVDPLPRDREAARRLVRAVLGPDAPEMPGFILDDVVRRVERGPSPRLWASFREDDLVEDRLGEVRVPTDVVWGSADTLLPVAYGRRLAAEIPGARFHLLEGCAHAPQVMCAERVAELLCALLEVPGESGGKGRELGVR